jgi:hypothetical protein
MAWNGLIWLWRGAREIDIETSDYVRSGIILYLLNDYLLRNVSTPWGSAVATLPNSV